MSETNTADHIPVPSSSSDETDEPVVYADDAEDNKFVHCLVRTVEQFLLYDRLRKDGAEAREKLTTLQRTYDDHMRDVRQYEECHEPALDTLITYTEELATTALEESREWTHRLEHTDNVLRKNEATRERLVRQLYDDSERFSLQVIYGGANFDPLEFDVSFHRKLVKLKTSAQTLKSFEDSYNELRNALISSQREVEAIAADPQSTREDKLAAQARRKEALASKQKELTRQERRRENQLWRELVFFAEVAYSILVDGRVLPRQGPPSPSPSNESMSRFDERSSPHMQVEAPLVAMHPKRQALLDARAEAANVWDRLDVLRCEYVFQLGETLVVHPGFTRATHDKAYAQEHDGVSFTKLEAEILHEVLQVDAACGFAWREAVKAHVTDLPPSPTEFAARTNDGYESSMDTESRAATQQKTQNIRPSVRQWGKKVAKAGDPLSPSAPPVRTFTGKRKLPHGEFPDREDFDDDSRSKRTRARADENKQVYNDRFLLQDTKRQRTGVVHAVKRALGLI